MVGPRASIGSDLEAQSFDLPTRKFSLIRRITTKSSKLEDYELGISALHFISPSEEAKIFDSLVTLMVGNESLQQSKSLNFSCKWFRRYLRNTFIKFWPLIRRAINDVDPYSPRPSRDELEKVVKFVLEIARALILEPDLAISEIVDHLVNHNYFKQELVDSDGYRIIPNQLVFAVMGWLLCLYQVPLTQLPHMLQIKDTLTTSLSPTGYSLSRNVRALSQGFGYIESPIHKLLNQFGDIIPEVKPEVSRRDSVAPISEKIDVQLVCYGTALNVTELRIEWVESVGLHLELDEHHQTIKLFRFPSYCRMLCHKQNIYLVLLTDLATSKCDQHAKEVVVRADNLFRELLLTYRLFFGQDERSYRAFARSLPAYDRDWDCSARDPDQISDQMLPLLCGRSCESPDARAIYDDIDAGDPSECYDSVTDFPIWGAKLCELQRFIKEYNVKSVKAQWMDPRDPIARYNFRMNHTVWVFGCAAILLNILQLVFQAWQVFIAVRQPTSAST